MAMKHPQQGFTLLELMIVLVILGIIVAMAIPMFDAIDKRRVRTAAEEIYSTAQYARSEAIKQSRNMFFVARTDGTNWCVGVGDADCNCLAGACSVRNTLFNVATSRTQLVNGAGVALTAASPVAVQYNYVRGTVTGNNTVGVQHTTKPATGSKYQLDVVASPMGRVRMQVPDAQNAAYFGEYKQ